MRLALLALVAACHPYVSAGADATWRVHGPLASTVNQPVAARAASSTSSSSDAAPVAMGGNYAIAFGSTLREFQIGIGLAAHDATAASFGNLQTPDAPHYLAATGTFDITWNWLKWRWVSTNIHVGPARSLLLDRTTGDRTWGFGVRYGAGLAVTAGSVGLFADAYRAALVFDGGPAPGFSDVTGVTVGIALHR
jgi:hypothetical protein